ncbi:MAG: MFS transporter, partial [Loktanella sp.]|nr:MFS transporter [Loktanella sp.]
SWGRLAVTLAIATIGNVGMWSVIVIMPAVQAEFGVSRAESSLPYTLTMLGFGLGNLLIGRAVDRFGMTTALIGASLTSGIGYLAAAVSAASFGPLIADISLWFQRRRGIAVAVAASGNYLSGAIWPMLLAGMLLDHGWRAVCLALAVIVTALLIPLAMLLRRRVPQRSMDAAAHVSFTTRAASGLSPRRLAWLLAFAGLGCYVAMSMPQVHIVALCIDRGFGPAVGVEMLSLMLLGGVVSRVVSGLVADQLGGVRTLLIGSVLQMLALFLYLPAGGLVSLYVVSLVFGLAQGGIVPAYALIVREYMPAQEAGARVGFVIMATILGMALGGWMSGWIHDLTGSYQLAFLNGIVWNAFNIAIMLFILTRTLRPRGRIVAAA